MDLPVITWTAPDDEPGGSREADKALPSSQGRTRSSRKGKAVKDDKMVSKDEQPALVTVNSQQKSSNKSTTTDQAPAKAPQNFEFINSTGNIEKSRDTRKFVRSHAMKWFARERSLKRGSPSSSRSRSAGPPAAADVSLDAERTTDSYIGDPSNPDPSPPFSRPTTPLTGAIPFDWKPHYQRFSRDCTLVIACA